MNFRIDLGLFFETPFDLEYSGFDGYPEKRRITSSKSLDEVGINYTLSEDLADYNCYQPYIIFHSQEDEHKTLFHFGVE